MHKKRGEVVSVDLIIGVVLFLFALGLFYNYITSMQEKPSVSFQIPADYLFDGIELGLDKYPDKNFFEENSYRVNVTRLEEFERMIIVDNDYETTNKIVTGNVELPLQIKRMDFCMYFENNANEVIKSIGNSTMQVGDGEDCGNDGFAPKPSCPEPFTHGLRLTRPVVYDYPASTQEIVRMHVLLCGIQI